MSDAVVELVADWLADATLGVNAVLAALPTTAFALMPAPVVVADASRASWLARGAIPQRVGVDAPIVGVQRIDRATYEWPPSTAASGAIVLDASVPLLMQYLVRQTSTAGLLARNATSVLRAVLGSLALLTGPAGAGRRVRDGVEVVAVLEVTAPAVLEELGDALVTGALLVTVATRETLPRLVA